MAKKFSLKVSMIFISALLGASSLLGGCGFQPLYQNELQDRQSIDLHITGAGYSTYKFRRELEKQLLTLPKKDHYTYKLNISVVEVLNPLSFLQDATISRFQSQLKATYTLSLKDKKIVQNTVDTLTSFPVVASDEFVTRTAQEAASERLSISLAQDVVREVAMAITRKDQGIEVTDQIQSPIREPIEALNAPSKESKT